MVDPEELLERNRELQLLSEAVVRARLGSGGVVLISGDAGIGKTSLLRAFLATLPADVTVLTGAGEDLYTSRVLGPFREMFPGHHVTEMDQTVGLLLEAAAGPSPVVAVIDDAHWADDSSLDVIRYVGHRLTSTHLLLVIAYRREDAFQDQALRSLLGALLDPDVVRIELEGLSVKAVKELARRAGVPWQRVADLGGNAFLVTEVLRSPDTEVPSRIRDAVVGRVAVLPTEVRHLMETLAVIPRATSLTILEQLGLGHPDMLEVATRAGLVEVRNGQVSYRHEISRRAVEARMSPAARFARHRQVLAALETIDADPSLLLHHAIGAQDHRAVARHAPEAAAKAAHADAHREVLAAAQAGLVDEVPLSPTVWAELQDLATQACFSLNRMTEAWEHACAAVTGWARAETGSERHVQALLVKARMAALRGDPATVATCAGDVISLSGSTASPALSRAHETLATLAAVSGDNHGAIRHATLALEIADALAAPALQAQVDVPLGLAYAALGDPQGPALLRHAIRSLHAKQDTEQEGRALANLGVVSLAIGDLAAARRHFGTALLLAHEHEQESLGYFATAHLANLDLIAGHWDAAESALRELLERQPDAAALRTLPEAFLGRLLLRRGSPEATELLSSSWRGASESGQVRRMLHAALPHLELAWLQTDRIAGLRWGTRCLGLATCTGSTSAHAETIRWLDRLELSVPGLISAEREPVGSGVLSPFENALTLTDSRDPKTASRGVVELERLGARATADRARAVLRTRGVTGLPRRPAGPPPVSGLTTRQHEVLSLIAEGLSTREVSTRLHLSTRTVDNHVGAALQRLGVTTRHEAVRTAGLNRAPEQSTTANLEVE